MRRGPVGVLVVSIVLLAVAALVVGTPGAREKVLPSAALAFVEGYLGPVGVAPAPGRSVHDGDVPADFLTVSVDGLHAEGPIAARPGNDPVFIKDVITGYTTSVSAGIPAEITMIRPILGCFLTPPQAGTLVGHATSGRSTMPLALSTYNDTHLADAVQALVNLYRKTGQVSVADRGDLTYQAYDVAVTETAAPVYLVLENRVGNRIWNIHLADGARIERVVLLGGGQAGVANLDPVVPIEVILDAGLAACGIRPAYEPNIEPGIAQEGLDSADLEPEDTATLAKIYANADAYDIWFRDSFDLRPGQSRAGFEVGTISHIGPVPGVAEPKAKYAPINGAKIRMTQDKFFEIKGQVAEGADFAARVRAIATAFAFGDLGTLMQGVAF